MIASRRLLVSLAAIAPLFVSGWLPSAPAIAASAPGTPADSAISDIEVDAAHHHVFVTSFPSPESASVFVYEYSGRLVGSIPDEPGAAGMVLDGDLLYVALWGADAISTIDTETLTELARTPLQPYLACPTSMTRSGARLWFGYTCDFDSGGVGYLDLTTGDSGALEPGGSFYNPLVAARGDILMTSDRGLSPVTLYQYDVSGVPRLIQWEFDPGGNTSDLLDLDISADGNDVLVTALTPNGYVQAFDMRDLQLDATYGVEAYPNGVDVAPDGTMVMAGHLEFDPALFFYSPGSSSAFFTEEVEDFALNQAEALSPDLWWVFTVIQNEAHRPQLNVIRGPANTFLELQADRHQVALGREVRFRGLLTLPMEPGPGGRTLRLNRVGPNGSNTFLGEVITDPDGRFGFSDTAPNPGSYTYRATFPGDDVHPKASISTGVTVHAPAH